MNTSAKIRSTLVDALQSNLIEPTDQNLQRYQRETNGMSYWHTADFFYYDKALEVCLSDLFDTYTDLLFESDDVDEDTVLRRVNFQMGRLLIQTARERGIAPQALRDQLNNFATVIWTPICIWHKNLSGEMSYALMSSLPTAQAAL
ncbi:hypothetical protein H6F86_03875 [Phormidium sp. FACHB-592]|uniref:Uncharacterized protein n=1 Tax=Stenomitos frigidus AS-A4 TaxID=2933935 RepID=A0ABV0KQM2_9CYAN|nr:hypothetical protein [Phormidium sp. FACHB-592]MBD2073038.1 hypothetical protein [Phormidium sp. FACHB-592]